MIWMVGAIASATIPTAALIANLIFVKCIRQAVENSGQALCKTFHKWETSTTLPSTERRGEGGLPEDGKSEIFISREKDLAEIAQKRSDVDSGTQKGLKNSHDLVCPFLNHGIQTSILVLIQLFRMN
jgi:hypothetical protein